MFPVYSELEFTVSSRGECSRIGILADFVALRVKTVFDRRTHRSLEAQRETLDEDCCSAVACTFSVLFSKKAEQSTAEEHPMEIESLHTVSCDFLSDWLRNVYIYRYIKKEEKQNKKTTKLKAHSRGGRMKGEIPKKVNRWTLERIFRRNSADISYRVYVYFHFFTRNFLILDKICGSKNWGGPTCRALKRRQVTLKAAALTNTYLQKYTHEQLTYPLRISLLTSRATGALFDLPVLHASYFFSFSLRLMSVSHFL